MKTAVNDAGTHLTWMDALRPETADVTVIDEGSPLWSVYEGARNDLPVATAVPTSSPDPGRPEDTPSAIAPAAARNKPNEYIDVLSHETLSDDAPNGKTDETDASSTASSTGLDLLMGCILSLVAITTVFFIELIGCIIYVISAGFYKMADALNPPNILTGLFYSIFLLVYWVLAIVDTVLLLVSVLVAEVVAVVSYLFSCLLGGCDVALRWHQYIRKTCHRTRWAFRCRLAYENPPRQFCGWGHKEEEVEFEKPGAVDIGDEYRLKQGSTTTVPSAPCQDEEDPLSWQNTTIS